MEGRTAVEPEEIIELATQVMRAEGAAVSSAAGQLNKSLVEAANLMLGCQGHILVAGSGTSHPVAARMAHLLSCCGTPALFIHPGDSQHGLAGAVKETDILIAISKGGETAEVITLAKTAKERGAKLIGLTEKPGSSLGQLSDIILNVISPPDIDPFGMIATGSSLVNAAFGDALCVVLLKLRGYSLVDFGATHPGGAVGQKLKEIL
jgi:D-arabinose 5-phosphate isomerase GutQ